MKAKLIYHLTMSGTVRLIVFLFCWGALMCITELYVQGFFDSFSGHLES